MSSPEKYARRQRRIEKGLLATSTQPRLPYSSIDSGALEVRDINGQTVGIIGQQWDGTTSAASVGGTTPVAPTVPLVTAKLGGLGIYWDGTYIDDSPTRMDFRRVTFHAVTDVDDLDVLSPTQIVGEITIATGGEVFATLPPVEHFVFAVTWTEAGKFSVESDVAFGTPLEIDDLPAFTDALAEIADVTASVADAPAVFRQTTEPVVDPGKKAIWYDTDNGNVPWFFDGAIWTMLELGEGALAADAVIASTIAVGALDGKTITGPLIQTMLDADLGIKLVNNTLLAFDETGTVVFLLDADTGDITLTGALWTGGDITGADITGSTVTGGVLRTAVSGERLEINTDVSDASTLRFYSGLAEEVNPTQIQADSVKLDSSNIMSGIAMSAPGISGQSGSSSISMGAGRGSYGAPSRPANNVRIEAFNDGVSTPAQVNVQAGAAAFVAYDPPGASNDIAKITGSAVQLETFATATKIGQFGSANQCSILAPIGEVVKYIGLGAAPEGWAYLDGQELAISAYTELYNLLTTNGTVFRYGANTNGSGGAGSTHFRMPNAKGRTIVHLDTAQTEFDVMGETGGAKTHTLTAAESGIPQHYHSIPMAPTSGFVDTNDGPLRASGSKDNNFKTGGVSTSSVYGTGTSGAQNASAAHNNLQPYLTLRYMMRLKG